MSELEALNPEQDEAAEATFAAKAAVLAGNVAGARDRPIRWLLLAFLSALRWILRRLMCEVCGKGRRGRGISI